MKNDLFKLFHDQSVTCDNEQSPKAGFSAKKSDSHMEPNSPSGNSNGPIHHSKIKHHIKSENAENNQIN